MENAINWSIAKRLSVAAICAALLSAPQIGSARSTVSSIAASQVTITVNTLDDKVDPNDGKCSFREAMGRAFGAPGSNLSECPASQGNTLIKFAIAGTIVLSANPGPGLSGRLPDTTGLVTIQGPITIDAGAIQEIPFNINSNGKFNLINVNIKNATYSAIDSTGDVKIVGGKFENNSVGGAGGGAIRSGGTVNIAGTSFKNNNAVHKPNESGTKDGGAIRTSWVLTVAGAKFEGNVADGEGGAIMFVAGRMSIADTSFKANVAKGQPIDLDYSGDGGAFGDGGGAIATGASGNTYPITIKRSTFEGNTASEGQGGAIFHNGGTDLTITDSSFQGNHAGSPGKLRAGGAIYNVSSLITKRTVFIGNSVEGDGGALANDNAGTAKLLMAAFTGNNASGKGGAIANMNLTNSAATINAIGTAINGNIAGSKGGGIYNHDSKYDTAAFRMSVFSGNLPQNCRDKTTADENTPDPNDTEQWPLDSKGQNSFSDDSCAAPDKDDEKDSTKKFETVPAPNGSTIPGMLVQMPLITSTLVDTMTEAQYNPDHDPDLEDTDIRGLPRLANGKGFGGPPLFDIGPVERDKATPEFSSLPAPNKTIDIGNAAPGTFVTKTNVLRIFDAGGKALTLSGLAVTGDFNFELLPSVVSPLGSMGYDVGCKPAALGNRTGTLSFNTNDPDKSQVSYSLTCTGVNIPTPGFRSAPIAPGPLSAVAALGTPIQLALVVSELGNGALTLSNPALQSDPPGALTLTSAFPVNIPNGGAPTTVQVACTSAALGLATGTLNFTTNDPSHPAISINLTCDVQKPADKVFPVFYWGTSGLTPNPGPYGIALSPDGHFAYVADEGSSKIAVFDAWNENTDKSWDLSFKSSFDSASLAAGNRFTSPLQVAVSQGGRNVYAAGTGADSIASFTRNEVDGSLTWLDTVHQGDGYGCHLFLPCVGAVSGLNGAYGMALSPDGNFVYVSAINDSAVVVLLRDSTTGALTSVESNPPFSVRSASFVQKYTNPNLLSAYGIALSPDGGQLYVTGYSSNSLLVLQRDPISGTLATAQVLTTSVSPGLEGVFRVIVSSDGRFVYTAGGNTGTGGVCAFKRSAIDGTLTRLGGCYVDSPLRALDGASDLALSPDGRRLFVTSRLENGISAFDRNPQTGFLTFVESSSGTGTVGPVNFPPLGTARGVAVAPDGNYVYATGFADDAVVSFPKPNPVPVLTALTPASAVAGSFTTTVFVNGEGFVPASVVKLGGAQRATSFVNETRLKVILKSSDLAAVGAKNLTVETPGPGGGVTLPFAFNVVAGISALIPAVDNISVLGLVAGSAQSQITINGRDFVPSAVVFWNGSPRPTTFVNNQQLTALIQSDDLTQAGESVVTVKNTAVLARTSVASAPSNKVAITVVSPNANPPPALTSMSPTNIRQLTDITQLDVLLVGNGFSEASVALWNGNIRPTHFLDATHIRVTLNGADTVDLGRQSITIENPAPGGGISNVLGFEVLPPTTPSPVLLPLLMR